MKYGVYIVTGSRRYRGHEQGERFVARLDPRAEARAIMRGDIQCIGYEQPSIEPGRLTFPDGWLAQSTPTTEGAERRLSHSRR